MTLCGFGQPNCPGTDPYFFFPSPCQSERSETGSDGSQFRDEVPDEVLVRKKITTVGRDPTGKPVLVFEDGSEEQFDLLIGADGIKSVVKEAVVGDKYPPIYTCAYSVDGGTSFTDYL